MEEKDLFQEQIQSALEDTELPTIYFNGFIATVGVGDILIALKHQDRVVAILNASHTVGKTLGTKLAGAIATLEQRSGHTIMTTDDITSLIVDGDNDNSE
jgi:hypothetical protein